MRRNTFEYVELRGAADTFPIRSSQSAALTTNAVRFSLLSVLAAVIVLPQIAIAGYAIASPSLRAVIAAQPMIALQLAVALIVWIALFAWPLSRLFARLTWRRSVEITPDNVSVSDDLAFGSATWTAPLASYLGVAHHIRSSLSGNRHELVLVHPDPGHSVLLLLADYISDADVTRMTALLRLPQVPAVELYRGRNNAGQKAIQINAARAEGTEWQAVPA